MELFQNKQYCFYKGRSMRIVITGAGGFIGRALASSLANKGHQILAIDNNSRGNLDLIETNPNIEHITCDILDQSKIISLTNGADAIYHLAYINGTKYFYTIPEKILEVGIIGTHNILKACIKNKVPNFFLASSSEVYQTADEIPTSEEIECKVPDVLNPRYSYGGGKIASELLTINYLRSTDIRFVIFRPHNVYGPQMGFEHVIPELIGKIHKSVQDLEHNGEEYEIEIQGSGNDTRSFIYIDDAVKAIELCTIDCNDRGIYHIGNIDENRIIQLIRLLEKLLQVNLKIKSIDKPVGSTSRRCPDNRKIRSLGYEQEFSLQEGLKKTIKWYWNEYKERKYND